jgi:YVTN family beta-propeller protein
VPLPAVTNALAADPISSRLFVASNAGISILDATTGALQRTVRTGSSPIAVAVDTQAHRVYVVNGGDDSVSILVSSTGTVLRTIKIGPHPLAVAVDEQRGLVAVASTAAIPGVTGSSVVAMLDARSGLPVRTTQVGGSPLSVLADQQDARMLVDIGTSVVVLDSRTGAVLRTIPLRGARVSNQGMALDARSGHAFAVNTYDPGTDDPGPLLRFAQRWLPWLSPHDHGQGGSVTIWDAGG